MPRPPAAVLEKHSTGFAYVIVYFDGASSAEYLGLDQDGRKSVSVISRIAVHSETLARLPFPVLYTCKGSGRLWALQPQLKLSLCIMSNQSRQGYVLHAPLSELSEVLALEERLLFDKFGVKEIQEIGDNITKAIEGLGKPVSALVDISLVNGPTSVFRRIASSGYNERPVHFGLDNEQWVVRKRNTVIRWGTSTWAANRKYGGDEEAFARRFMLGWGAENAAKYAIHGKLRSNDTPSSTHVRC